MRKEPEETKDEVETENTEDTEQKAKEPTLEEQLNDTKDQLLRTAAEYANYRARSAKEKEQTYNNAKGNVTSELLPVIDNLERALSGEGNDFEALKQGVQMTMDGLMASLTKLGVEQFGEAGDTFDPNFHNQELKMEII